MKRIAIIGTGGWGTALSIVAGRAGHDVRLWSRSSHVAEEINRGRVNSAYLARQLIPENVSAITDLTEALRGAESVVLAAPSHAMRSVLKRVMRDASEEMIFVSATKGVEAETGRRISEIVNDESAECLMARPLRGEFEGSRF